MEQKGNASTFSAFHENKKCELTAGQELYIFEEAMGEWFFFRLGSMPSFVLFALSLFDTIQIRREAHRYGTK